jgi:hypothetical protein
MFWRRPTPDSPRCSFCHKAEDAARVLIPAPSNNVWNGVYICSECVATCNDILADRRCDQQGRSLAQDPIGNNDAPPVVHLSRNKTTTVRDSLDWPGLLKPWRRRKPPL